jgi:hypothetical protein
VKVNDFTRAIKIWISHAARAHFAHLLVDAKQVGDDVIIWVDRTDLPTLRHMTSALHCGPVLRPFDPTQHKRRLSFGRYN